MSEKRCPGSYREVGTYLQCSQVPFQSSRKGNLNSRAEVVGIHESMNKRVEDAKDPNRLRPKSNSNPHSNESTSMMIPL